MAAIQLFEGELDQLGMTLVNDKVALNGNKFERTITLSHDDTIFTTDEARKEATRNLYGAKLNLEYPGAVEALEPDVTP